MTTALSPAEIIEKEQNTEPVLLWLDLETTGLNPADRSASILEVGLVVTENDVVSNTLKVIHEKNWIVAQELHLRDWPAEVVDMHGKSGLLGDLAKVNKSDTRWMCTWDRVEREFGNIVMNSGKHAGKERIKPLLCGNSVHFDRSWIAQFSPSTLLWTHHRMIDVSAIYEMLLRSKHRQEAFTIKENCGEKAHRALVDCYTAIHLYEEFRKLLDL